MSLQYVIGFIGTALALLFIHACTNRLPTLREMRAFRHHGRDTGHVATHHADIPTQLITCECGRRIELRRPK